MSAGREKADPFATPAAAGETARASMAGSACSGRSTSAGPAGKNKPPFRPAPDDTKPILRDPISRPDPVETEQAVLRLPPFPYNTHSTS